MTTLKAYSLWFDDEENGAAVAKASDLKGLSKWCTRDGEAQISWPDGVTFTVDEGLLQDYLFNAENWLVVSGRARECLESTCGGLVQFLPITLMLSSGTAVAGNYCVANVTKRLAAFDKEKSKWKPLPGISNRVTGVIKWVLRGDAVGETSIFRLEENSDLLVVSSVVRDAITASRLTGFKFKELRLS